MADLYFFVGVMIDGIVTADLGAGGVRIGSSTSRNVSYTTVQNSYLLDGGHTLYEGKKEGIVFVFIFCGRHGSIGAIDFLQYYNT